MSAFLSLLLCDESYFEWLLKVLMVFELFYISMYLLWIHATDQHKIALNLDLDHAYMFAWIILL